MKTIDHYFEEAELTVEDVAEQANMPFERVQAIALGRWTPSPRERAKIAEVIGVTTADVSWGHTLDPRNLRYRRFGLKEDF